MSFASSERLTGEKDESIMKETEKNRRNKVDEDGYELSPWGEDDPVLRDPIEDDLPPPSAFKHITVRYIDDNDDSTEKWHLPLAPKDVQAVQSMAKEAGLSTEAFTVGIMHDFLAGNLIRPGHDG